jgi:ankyrin repeat protein
MPVTKNVIQQVFTKYSKHPEFLGIEIVDPNQPGAVDDTLLHLTARRGALDDIQTLVAAGADINIIGDLGNTPLHSAAMTGQLDAVKLLLKLGANPSIKNEFNQTPADVAKLGGYNHITDTLTSSKS